MPTEYNDDTKVCPECGDWCEIDQQICDSCSHIFDLPETREVLTEWGSVTRKSNT